MVMRILAFSQWKEDLGRKYNNAKEIYVSD